jgi:transposase
VANLLRLKEMFPKHRFLYLGDSKLDTPENLAAAQSTAGEFLCTGAFTPALQEKFRKVRHLLRPVNYCPKTHEQRPPEERDCYQGVEVADEVTGEFEGRKIKVKYRLLFVHSTAKAQQQVATRERHLAKIRAEFEQTQKILGKYSLKTEEAIRRRFRRPTYRVANGPGLECFQGIREQSRAEKRFHHLRGPAVSPTFLKNPKRIAGLLAVLILALTVMSLMEREVRKNLKGQPMYGIYPENRPSPAPTGPKLIAAFSTLCMVIIHEHGQTYRRLAQLTPVQKQIIDLLSLPEGLLKTFKRRCGM